MQSASTTLRIGTRASELALWQAEHIANSLKALGIGTKLVRIITQGDADQQNRFAAMGGKGIFVKEIETALLRGEIDLAVHSLKDLPTELPSGLVLAAVPEREDVNDVLVTREVGKTLMTLPERARVATGSLRRAAQVLAQRPDLIIVPLRGNVPTRLRKVAEGEADATLMARAGLKRLGLTQHIAEVLPVDVITPPMGQGALGIESRAGEWTELFAQLEHPTARKAVDAERELLRALHGGCSTPAGALATPLPGGGWRMIAMLALPDGTELHRITREAEPEADLRALARELARGLLTLASPGLQRLVHTPPEPVPVDNP